MLTSETADWLLSAPEPYIRYQAQRLVAPKKADASLLDEDPFIRENLAAVSKWRKDVLERHDKPDLFIHRLAMLADLGVTTATAGAAPIVEDMLSNIGADGTFPIGISVPVAFGGTGKAHDDWIVCDFPVVLYALRRIAGKEPRLRAAYRKLASLAGEEFYPCCGSIPKFKGPGPRGGMCPYANLLVARAMSADASARGTRAARVAAEAILWHWSARKEKKPFLFAMGTDFAKLKFPMVWYNLLHAVSALKGIEGAASDPRFLEMAAILRGKLDASGRARPESVYMAYKGQEWSDKKGPSRLMTVMVHRALSGVGAEARPSSGRSRPRRP
jgi:hypothetical protein